MEPVSTPLSSRRISRSLAAAAASTQKSAAGGIQRRAALHDITNDSPIVGLAAAGLADRTPQASSAAAGAKARAVPRRTPGSGEALLRGQVKTLLRKVDEEAIKPVRIMALLGLSRSPAQLLAPTPANTPQIGTEPAAVKDITAKLQVMAAPLPPPPAAAAEEEDPGEGQLSRALVFDDSPGKPGHLTVDLLTTTFHGSSSGISPDDDTSSVWSVQVNVCSEEEAGEDAVTMVKLGEEDYRTEDELEEQVYSSSEEDWQDEDDDECFDDLCDGMSNMTAFDRDEEEGKKKKKGGLPAFTGTHTRFLYSSDGDEIVERKEVANAAAEHDALLRGLPVPEGKHLSFYDDDEEE